MSDLLDSVLTAEQLAACRVGEAMQAHSGRARGPSRHRVQAGRGPKLSSQEFGLAYGQGWLAYYLGIEPADQAQTVGWLDAFRADRDAHGGRPTKAQE